MSELIKVYSPEGEMFENSPVNARDLVVHAGWSYDKFALEINEDALPVVSLPEPEKPVEDEVIEPVAEELPVEEAPVEEVVEEDEVLEESKNEEQEEVKAPVRGRKKKS